MKKLLQLEFIKYTQSKMFYAFIGLFMVIVVLAEVITINVGGRAGLKFGYPDAWGNLVYVASWVNFFLGMVILFSITTEYQYRTFRQHIVDGLGKTELFAAKYLYAIGLALFAVVFVSVTVVVLSAVYGDAGNTGSMFTGAGLLGRYFVQLMGYISMAVFFAVVFRNTILAVLVYLFYMPIESLLGLAMFHKPSNVTVPDYFPKKLFASIVPEPAVLKTVQKLAGLNTSGPSESTVLILGCVYVLMFSAASLMIIRNRDL